MNDKPGFVKNVVGMFKDKQTPLRDKLLMAGGVAYLVSPVDLIPDLLLLLGYTDDLGVVVGTGTLFYKNYKNYVKRNKLIPPQQWNERLDEDTTP